MGNRLRHQALLHGSRRIDVLDPVGGHLVFLAEFIAEGEEVGEPADELKGLSWFHRVRGSVFLRPAAQELTQLGQGLVLEDVSHREPQARSTSSRNKPHARDGVAAKGKEAVLPADGGRVEADDLGPEFAQGDFRLGLWLLERAGRCCGCRPGELAELVRRESLGEGLECPPVHLASGTERDGVDNEEMARDHVRRQRGEEGPAKVKDKISDCGVGRDQVQVRSSISP